MNYIRIHRKSHFLELYAGEKRILSFPCSVGKKNDAFTKLARGDMRTPLGRYFITDKKILSAQPTHGTRWIKINYPSEKDIRTGFNIGLLDRRGMKKYMEEYLLNGGNTRKRGVIGFGVGIHGTDSPGTIGKDETEGCVRLSNEDMEKLYESAEPGMTVIIEND